MRRSLKSSGTHWPSVVFQAILAFSLLVSLLVLMVLLLDVLSRGLPVLMERGVDFLTAPLSANPNKAGIGQALWGTFVIGVIVVLVAVPLGIGTAVYLEEYAAIRASLGSSTSTSATWPAFRRSSMACWGWQSSWPSSRRLGWATVATSSPAG